MKADHLSRSDVVIVIFHKCLLVCHKRTFVCGLQLCVKTHPVILGIVCNCTLLPHFKILIHVSRERRGIHFMDHPFGELVVTQSTSVDAHHNNPSPEVEEEYGGKTQHDERDDGQDKDSNIDQQHEEGNAAPIVSLVLAADAQVEEGVEVDDEVVEPGDSARAADGDQTYSLDHVAFLHVLFDSMIVSSNGVAVILDSHTCGYYLNVLVYNPTLSVKVSNGHPRLMLEILISIFTVISFSIFKILINA